jgi:hypothetical protein
MQASSRWDLTRGDLCSRLQPGQRTFTSRTVTGVLVHVQKFFNFDLTGGSQVDQPIRPPIIGPISLAPRENGVRQPGNERSRPQFKAHNSVRPLKNGLSLGGSSATRPQCQPSAHEGCQWGLIQMPHCRFRAASGPSSWAAENTSKVGTAKKVRAGPRGQGLGVRSRE